jgi:hypothetical protein
MGIASLFEGWIVNWLSGLFGPDSMTGWVIAFALSVAWLLGWHHRQRAANNPGMASWYFIVPCFLFAAGALAFGGYGIWLLSRSSPAEAKIVSDVHLWTQAPPDGQSSSNIIGLTAQSKVSGRIRVFIEYSLYPVDDNKWSQPIKYELADIPNVYEDQRLNLIVARKRTFKNKEGAMQWDYRFGREGSDENYAALMPDFEYKTRLIFEADKQKQFFPFRIVKPETVTANWNPKIMLPDDPAFKW